MIVYEGTRTEHGCEVRVRDTDTGGHWSLPLRSDLWPHIDGTGDQLALALVAHALGRTQINDYRALAAHGKVKTALIATLDCVQWTLTQEQIIALVVQIETASIHDAIAPEGEQP